MKIFNLSLVWFLAIAIALISFTFMYRASLTEGVIMDELAHIPAGYSYVKLGDYRLNPEHPPLVKALAALPLLAYDLNFDTEADFWQKDLNGQWTAGTSFLFESDNDPDQILQATRLAPMLLTVILILFTYFWASQLIGRVWALLPTFLLGLSPTILSHGHYVTTDVGAALGIIISSYFFLKFIKKPNWPNILYAGLAFGFAGLLKFSTVLLVPFFIIITIIFIFLESKKHTKNLKLFAKLKYLCRLKIRFALYLLSIFLVGTALIYFVYLPFTINYPTSRQFDDTTTTLMNIAGGPTPTGEICAPVRCLADLTVWLGNHRLTQPLGEYLLGLLMVVGRAEGGNTAFFLGEVSNTGWWYYFPTALVLKEPLPTLILILVGLLLSFINIKRVLLKRGWALREYLNTNFTESAMIIFIVFYWAYSMKSPLNIGIRHIIPTLPFIYILTASSLKRWLTPPLSRTPHTLIERLKFLHFIFKKSSLKLIFILLMIVWLFTEIVISFPHFLSYYNELAGGTKNGYHFITDSNYDWGQDAKSLTEYANNKGLDKIAVDYFGGDNPAYRLGDKFVPWWSAKNNPAAEDINWLAVSVGFLAEATAHPVNGFTKKDEDKYLWLKTARALPVTFSEPPPPDDIIGTSIFIYHLK